VPPQYVMVSVNGSVPMSFAASEEPAAYGELVSIGGIGPGVNGKLSAALAEILETKLSVSRSRFYIKFDDVKVFVFLHFRMPYCKCLNFFFFANRAASFIKR
jgi:phenylpyruvate tautomerase